MENVDVDFEILDHDKSTPVKCTQYSDQLIFDVKKYFTQKS